MSKRILTEQEKNLNASTLFTLFVAFQILSRSKVNPGFMVFLALGAIWATYEWAKWFRVSAANTNARVMSLAEVFRIERADISNSYIILGVVVIIPCFIMLGALVSRFYGAIIGFGFSAVYVGCMIIMRK